MLSLIGVPVVLLGLVLRFNPLLVVTAAALVTGLAAGVPPLALIAALGKAFNDARYVSVVFLVLPVVGLMERAGLQARARELVGRLRALTTGRLLLAYLAARQISAAVPSVVETLEDTPFYARSVIEAEILGHRVTAMHESLDMRRFCAPVVQAMLPFRMPRVGGG